MCRTPAQPTSIQKSEAVRSPPTASLSYRSVLQRDALGILVDVAAQDQNALDEAPDGADTEAQRQHQLRDGLAGEAQIEVVRAYAAQQNAQQPGGQLRLLLSGRDGMTAENI